MDNLAHLGKEFAIQAFLAVLRCCNHSSLQVSYTILRCFSAVYNVRVREEYEGNIGISILTAMRDCKYLISGGLNRVMIGEFKRSRLQVCFNVLEVIMKGVRKPTRIMYSANLSWNTTLEVFMVLIAQGLIKQTGTEGSKLYTLTEKGLDALTHYRKATESLKQEKTSWAPHLEHAVNTP